VAQEADLPALLALEREASSHPWSAASLGADLRRGGIVLLRAPGMGILAFCAFQVVLDELQITNLAVRRDHQRRCLGRLLLRCVLGLGAQRGASVAQLEVRRGNLAALGLYGSEGFATVGVRRDYYREPVEDALLLERRSAGLAAGPRGLRDP
jgi:ribosomal-protein-alanine N-acetyltransferase